MTPLSDAPPARSRLAWKGLFMRRTRTALLLAFSVLLIIGCGAEETNPPEPTSVPTNDVDVSPLPTAETVATLSPEPTLEASPLATPSPAPGTGSVVGILLSENPPQPYNRALLYLGRIHTTSDGSPIMASIEKSTAPKALGNEGGQFMFTGVPPGRYTLALDLITNTIILRHPTTGEDLIIEVIEGETTDLGELIYADLPQIP